MSLSTVRAFLRPKVILSFPPFQSCLASQWSDPAIAQPTFGQLPGATPTDADTRHLDRAQRLGSQPDFSAAFRAGLTSTQCCEQVLPQGETSMEEDSGHRQAAAGASFWASHAVEVGRGLLVTTPPNDSSLLMDSEADGCMQTGLESAQCTSGRRSRTTFNETQVPLLDSDTIQPV
ncbi:hypothetical protein AAHC03_01831 [Spirometra sp. Aus1]